MGLPLGLGTIFIKAWSKVLKHTFWRGLLGLGQVIMIPDDGTTPHKAI